MSNLQTKNLIKTFGGVHAVNNVSISFERGKITGLIGPNGSGKSTLINTLTGVIPMDGGEVIVGDKFILKNIDAMDILTYGITRTFQSVRLIGQMSVLDNILIVLTERDVFPSLFEKHNKFHHEKAKEILEMVGLWEKRNENAENLSYGQRKLLEIGRAIATGADTILFDEPFAGLFPEMVKAVGSILKDLKDKNKVIVLVEHNMDIIRDLTDYCYVLDSGKLIAEGKPSEVLKNSEVVEAYLGK